MEGRTRECECTVGIGVNGHGMESFWALVGWYGSLVAPCGCGLGSVTRLSNVTDFRTPFLNINVPYTHTTSLPQAQVYILLLALGPTYVIAEFRVSAFND